MVVSELQSFRIFYLTCKGKVAQSRQRSFGYQLIGHMLLDFLSFTEILGEARWGVLDTKNTKGSLYGNITCIIYQKD